ncbi:MAG TPA: c-type cytochrome [Sandaracinaceae bacterium LLY-WYZ-13_1]|nr:c-type cytochrome [Sandaracinaceae bacterium LLY-WYZ-13_1]
MRARAWPLALCLLGCGLNANDPYGDAPVVSLEDAPPPIHGGTLVVTRDARWAVASDPARDRVVVVDLDAHAVRAIETAPDAEPGRAVEDGVGRVYVALRRGGEVLAIEPATASVLERHAVCAAPRGLAWQADGDRLHVACADGTLATLGPDRTVQDVVRLPTDLRDVIVSGDGLLVSRFRSAELVRVRSAEMGAPRPLPVARIEGVDDEGRSSGLVQAYRPGVAVRLAATPQGPVVLHQRARIGREAVFEGTAATPDTYTYSNRPVSDGARTWRDPCDNAVVHAALTFLTADGAPFHHAPSIARGVLPVDVAVSDEGQVAVAFAGEPGNGFGFGPQVVRSTVAETRRDQASGCVEPSGDARAPGQAVAVAFAGERLVVQLREPARLVVDGEVIELGGASVRDTGHDVFHLDTGGAVACASCHPGGADDGHVWEFAALRPIRTLPLQGAIDMAPYHRAGDQPSFHALLTELQEQMAGPPLDEATMEATAHWLRRLPAPAAGPVVEPAAVERGRALFERADVGCVDCHRGPRGTDGESHRVQGEAGWQTPPLEGVALRAPYLHDGRAPDLRAVIEGGFEGDHGTTGHLSAEELDDLEAYLRAW